MFRCLPIGGLVGNEKSVKLCLQIVINHQAQTKGNHRLLLIGNFKPNVEAEI